MCWAKIQKNSRLKRILGETLEGQPFQNPLLFSTFMLWCLHVRCTFVSGLNATNWCYVVIVFIVNEYVYEYICIRIYMQKKKLKTLIRWKFPAFTQTLPLFSPNWIIETSYWQLLKLHIDNYWNFILTSIERFLKNVSGSLPFREQVNIYICEKCPIVHLFKLKTMIASPCHHEKVNAPLKQRRIADLDKYWQGKFKRELTVMMFGRFLPLTSPVDVYPNNCYPSHPSYCLFETRDTTAPFEFFTPSNLPKKDPKGASVWLFDYFCALPEFSLHYIGPWKWFEQV